MQNFLTGYQLSDATWLYLSFVLILAVYFKFSRLWSLRNLDLLLLLMISPGLLMLRSGEEWQAWGTWWLMGVSSLGVIRALLDVLFVRRPRLEQNMNAAGMSFLTAATVVFLTMKLLTDPVQSETVRALAPTSSVAGEAAMESDLLTPGTEATSGPTTALVKRAVDSISGAVVQQSHAASDRRGDVEIFTIRGLAILSHVAVIFGLLLVGRQVFGDPDLGFAMSSLYILMPCTAYDLGSVIQVLPAALVVWAICCYRSPFVAGVLLGLASGILFFPAFLLPVWWSFYGRRGGGRFALAVGLTAVLVVGALWFVSRGGSELVESTLGYVRWTSLQIWEDSPPQSFWGYLGPSWRLPLLVAFLVMVVATTLWPREKTLAHLIAHSAAVVLGAQLWYPHQGGVYVLWYLPLLLMVAFRPMVTNQKAPEITPLTGWFGTTSPATGSPAETVRV
ncbi:MAG: hypothetical protein ACK5TO_20085 [Planctomycetaceae bacterium]|jgi:hypothetical protein